MKRNRYTLSLLLSSALLAGGLSAVWADDLNDQLQDIQGQINASQGQQQQAESVIQDVTAQLKQIQSELDAAAAQLKQIQTRVQAVNANIAQTTADLQAAQAKLLQRQKILNQRIRTIYMHGQLNYLEVIMGSHSFSDFANRVELLKRIIRSDFNLINEIEAQKQAIEIKKAQLEAQKKELDQLESQAQQKKNEIAAHQAERQAVLQKAQNDKATAVQMEQDLQSASAEIQARIQAREQALQAAAAAAAQSSGGSGGDAGGNVVVGSGVFSWPVSGPITSPFGYRVHPIFGTTIFHSGIDIGVPEGTVVHAADAGTVISSGWLGGYGYAVIIDHGNGLQTVYGHNSSLLVSEGQSVSKGQPIAYSGQTGYATGPHVHFEVRVNGSPVDPMGYL